MNMAPKLTPSISKLSAIAVAAMALSFSTAGKAHADESASPAGTADDRQIVQQVLDLDRSEEQTSKAMKGKLGSAEAWGLADRIDVDYSALDREFRSVAGVAPESTDDRTSAAGFDLGSLSKLSGAALDEAYVDREVKAHEAMLRAIDNQLLPAAKTDEVRRSLIDLRAEATAHLAQARSVQYAGQVRAMETEERATISKTIGNDVP